MRPAILTMILLLVICFSLICWLEPRYEARAGADEPGGSVLADLLGDGRKFVADYFYVEADVYFHSGYYPSIFDQARQQEESDSDVSQPEEPGGKNAKEEQGFMGPPLDWIERLGRNSMPSKHTHLQGESVREILPWMKLSAELDPHRIQTYTVTAYWLRRRLHQSKDAEDFIRQGLKANPRSPELLYDLGQIYLKDRKDLPRAKNIFNAALRCWYQFEAPKPLKTENGEGERNTLLLEEILGGLVQDDLAAGNFNQALADMEKLKANATDPQGVQKQIDKLKLQIQNQAKPAQAPAK